MASKHFGILTFLFLVFIPIGATSGTSEHSSHTHRHLKYAQMKNPIPLTPESIATGKKVFDKQCVACHGKDAKGGIGPDLTDKLWIHGSSDGEIFHVISDGVAGTSMKRFKDQLSEEMRWHLVNYIRSAGKE